jgi:AcrR family transcriptional regulator
MERKQGKKRKTRKRPLTRERVLAAAVSLADKKGLAAVSMRKVAARLRVEAMSLYHHVRNKDEILDGMVDVVFAEVEVPQGVDWQTAMRGRAHSLRAAILRHPWAAGLLDSRRSPGPASLAHHDAVIRALREGGFSLSMTGHAFAVLDAFIYGFVLQQVSMPIESDAPVEQLGEDILAQLPADAYPHFVELTVGHAMQPGYAFADEFDYGLDLILEGLAARRDPSD